MFQNRGRNQRCVFYDGTLLHGGDGGEGDEDGGEEKAPQNGDFVFEEEEEEGEGDGECEEREEAV